MVYLGIISKKGRKWVKNNVSYEPWQGSLDVGGIYMESKFVENILESAKADGLTPDDIYFAKPGPSRK